MRRRRRKGRERRGIGAFFKLGLWLWLGGRGARGAREREFGGGGGLVGVGGLGGWVGRCGGDGLVGYLYVEAGRSYVCVWVCGRPTPSHPNDDHAGKEEVHKHKGKMVSCRAAYMGGVGGRSFASCVV